MDQVNKKNLEIIKEIIEKRFNYDDISNQKIFSKMFDPYMYGLYSKIDFDENFRKEFPIPTKYLPHIDSSWAKIKRGSFGKKIIDFIEKYNISYEEYYENKVKALDGMKFFKALKRYLKDRLEEEEINHLVESIGAKKIKKGQIKVVLSKNFADWFMCSTSENWKSCLSLESSYSASFWAGLPALTGDPNRAMIYITDGNTKTYNGITVDKFISRSWVLLGEDDSLSLLKWYPNSSISVSGIMKITGIDIFPFEYDNFYSKYQVERMNVHNGKRMFIYLDGSKLENDYICGCEDSTGFDVFDYSNGLNHLIQTNENLSRYTNKDPLIKCPICGQGIYLDEEVAVRFSYNGISEGICTDCAKTENFVKSIDGDYIPYDKAQELYDGVSYCFKEEAVYSNYYQHYISKNELIEVHDINNEIQLVSTRDRNTKIKFYNSGAYFKKDLFKGVVPIFILEKEKEVEVGDTTYHIDDLYWSYEDLMYYTKEEIVSLNDKKQFFFDFKEEVA